MTDLLKLLDEMRERLNQFDRVTFEDYAEELRLQYDAIQKALRLAYGALLTTQNVVQDDELRAVLIGKISEIEKILREFREEI